MTNPHHLQHPINEIHKILLNKTTNIYVLIDVNAKKGLRGELFNLSDAPKFRSLFHNTVLQELRDQSPFLLQIELNQYRYITYLFEKAPKHFLLIFSKYSLDILYQHWQSILTVYALNGDVAFYKFYSPEILKPYIKACKPSEQALLLAYCDEVYLYNKPNQWDRCYQVLVQEKISLPEINKVDPHLKTAWWQLKDHHFDYMSSITENALIENLGNHLLSHHMDALQAYKNRTLSKLISHGIQRARFYGLETREELSFFLGMMFELSPNFDEHPKIHQWLLNKTSNTSVLELVDQTPATVWDSLKNNSESQAWYKMPQSQKNSYHINNQFIAESAL
ncbi:MAG: DUF4123 domain-containing protein [Gammaproteobacteria bacterium]|nr:DUF4123 domain-containing protein [Gammaproteobacteria bacterium]